MSREVNNMLDVYREYIYPCLAPSETSFHFKLFYSFSSRDDVIISSDEKEFTFVFSFYSAGDICKFYFYKYANVADFF